MNIVFMGTPDFAVESLKALINSKHNISGVFCQPDRPQNRGHKMTFPPVKVCASENNIPVFQPVTLKDDEAFNCLKELDPDCIVVAAYGKILPENILNLPKYGCINVHASLLPKLRGAAPIQWSILRGDTETGVTVMQMAKGLDTGDMLSHIKTPIDINENASQLYERLSILGGELLIETLENIERGNITPKKQDDALSTYAPMLSKELSPIDWHKSALEIHNKIRGLHPWPIATTLYNGEPLKVYSSQLVDDEISGKPGEITDKKKFIVACGDGKCIRLTEVQLLNSKRMPAENMLCGHPVKIDILGEEEK